MPPKPPTQEASPVRHDVSLLTAEDFYLFNEGSHYRIYEKMGANVVESKGPKGAVSGVWAPNARRVSVIGSFNGWNPQSHQLRPRGSSGIWEGFIPGVEKGTLYKFHIDSTHHGHETEKADPVGLFTEKPPRTASVLWDLNYTLGDSAFLEKRAAANSLHAPMSIYEVHLGSWMLVPQEHNLTVSLVWVRARFPASSHGLAFFDGSHLFEHSDSRQGFLSDWKTLIFNYGRSEVRRFLMSSAMFWLDKYHVHGLRVDAVGSMLYLDYSRNQGEWIPNKFGGRENLEAIDSLRRFNLEAYKEHPDIQTYAEESTSYPMGSRPTHLGGLGFGLKWDMGWMHDTLTYFQNDPIHRKYQHNLLTFRMLYSFHENFVLPLSHDEVVHGKGSLIGKMPGDEWQKFANLRLLFAYMFAQPGKKLLFMGCEFGQVSAEALREKNHGRPYSLRLTLPPLGALFLRKA